MSQGVVLYADDHTLTSQVHLARTVGLPLGSRELDLHAYDLPHLHMRRREGMRAEAPRTDVDQISFEHPKGVGTLRAQAYPRVDTNAAVLASLHHGLCFGHARQSARPVPTR